MADVQKHFDTFDEAIKLGRFEENETLREKREIIRNRLKEKLPAVFEAHGEEVPNFCFRDQGSYAMGTGTKPIHGDMDIDQGMYLEVSTEDFDPVTLKKRVKEALLGHTEREPEIRRPCVTVWYQRDGEVIYHVDLAVYSDRSQNFDGRDYLACGRENSSDEHCYWKVSDPQALSDTIFERFDQSGRAQFRRVVRYLKRWKDLSFSENGNEAPLGIGLTVAAHYWLEPEYSDIANHTPDDLSVLIGLVESMLNNFQYTYHDWEHADRLIIRLPVEPGNDLFGEMTNRQQEKLKDRLEALSDALREAKGEVDPHVACQVLQGVFGDDFPVPAKAETAKRQRKPFASSSTAA